MYADYLMRLLEPLGVYDLRESSVSGAMLCALGAALDEISGQMQSDLCDAFPQNAEDLSRWERLLPPLPAQAGPETRRAGIVHLLSRPEVCCSAEAIRAALAACGIPADVAADGQDEATVTLSAAQFSDPDVRGLVRGLVPAQMDIRWETGA